MLNTKREVNSESYEWLVEQNAFEGQNVADPLEILILMEEIEELQLQEN